MVAQFSHYSTTPAQAGCGLCVWSFSALSPMQTRVVPDGCSDFIVDNSASDKSHWFISALSDSAYLVPTEKNAKMSGIRLQPGTQVDLPRLTQYLINRHPACLLSGDRLDEFCHVPANLSSALDRLALGKGSIKQAAQDIGITQRTLQREIARGTGRTPHYWHALARIRRSLRAVQEFDTLAELAAVFEFSDQAHLTRESKRWFGLPPSIVAGAPELIAQVREVGYGAA